MTIATLEKKLKPLEAPVDNELLRWLYLHLPPQPIKSRKMHNSYSEATRILMRESDGLDAENRAAVRLDARVEPNLEARYRLINPERLMIEFVEEKHTGDPI